MADTNILDASLADLEASWRRREELWRCRLGRLRLGAEPLQEQVARYRRVTWVLTAIPAALCIAFVTIFAVFGRPEIGLAFAVIVLLPIVAGAWIDHALLAYRAACYDAELGKFLHERTLRTNKLGE